MKIWRCLIAYPPWRAEPKVQTLFRSLPGVGEKNLNYFDANQEEMALR